MKYRNATILALAPCAKLAAAGATKSDGVDISGLVGFARITLDSTAGAAADNTLDVKLQESEDDVDAHYTDVADAAFTQVTNAAATFESLTVNVDGLSKFIRIVSTVAGAAPEFSRSVTLVGENQYSG